MKKLLIFIIIAFPLVGNAQQDTTKSDVDVYISAGLSISNVGSATFAASSYPSLETGIMKDNFSLGLVVGRSNLAGFNADIIRNYWYEAKSAYYFPVGVFSGYALFGIGNYIDTKRVFIEYGTGFAYTFDNGFGIYTQASNWDGFWYVTPGICYTF